eukprot:COSAG02_NODE_1750_length_11068_cov_7.252530_11_plen_59_part_00
MINNRNSWNTPHETILISDIQRAVRDATVPWRAQPRIARGDDREARPAATDRATTYST